MLPAPRDSLQAAPPPLFLSLEQYQYPFKRSYSTYLQLAEAHKPTAKEATLGKVGSAAMKVCRHKEVPI